MSVAQERLDASDYLKLMCPYCDCFMYEHGPWAGSLITHHMTQQHALEMSRGVPLQPDTRGSKWAI